MKPTPKQYFTLFQFTKIHGKKWQATTVHKDQATQIIGSCFELKDKPHDTTIELKLLGQVNTFFPEWTIDQFYQYLPKKGKAEDKKPEEKQPEPKESEPESEDDSEDYKQNPDAEPEDDEVEKAKKALEKAIEERERKKREAEEKAKKAEQEKSQPPKIEGYIKPDWFDEVFTLIAGGEQVLLTGPAGCGKSRSVKEIAKALDKPLYTHSFMNGIRYSQVIGGTKLSDGKTEWQPAQLLLDVQKPGIVFIDEIFACESEVLIGLNALTEPDTRCIQTPIGVINVHPECTIVAASNSNGRVISAQYTGVGRADDSTLDRFTDIPVTYDTKIEKALLINAGLSSADVNLLVENVKALRQAISTNNIQFNPSTRRLLKSARIINLGIMPNRAFELSMLTSLSVAERRKIGM